MLCKDNNVGSVYNHHFFECKCHLKNRAFFKVNVRKLYTESMDNGFPSIPSSVIDKILVKPCKMWVGLIDTRLFDIGLKLTSVHELHRIVVTASIMSWARFYTYP